MIRLIPPNPSVRGLYLRVCGLWMAVFCIRILWDLGPACAMDACLIIAVECGALDAKACGRGMRSGVGDLLARALDIRCPRSGIACVHWTSDARGRGLAVCTGH